MIHINSGMKYTTCCVSHPLIQNRYLSKFSLSSVRVSGQQKQKNASNTTAHYRERRYHLYYNTSLAMPGSLSSYLKCQRCLKFLLRKNIQISVFMECIIICQFYTKFHMVTGKLIQNYLTI